MIDSLFSLIFLPFSFEPVQACCCMSFVLSLFYLIRRFMIRDYFIREK